MNPQAQLLTFQDQIPLEGQRRWQVKLPPGR